MPPSSGSTSRSTTSSPSRARSRAPTATSPSRASVGRWASAATRATPAGVRTPSSPSADAGTPRTVPAGNGNWPSGSTTAAWVVAGATSRSASPSRSTSCTASGTRASTARGGGGAGGAGAGGPPPRLPRPRRRGYPRDHRRGAGVVPVPGQLDAVELAADAVAGLEDDDLVVRAPPVPLERGGQAGDP